MLAAGVLAAAALAGTGAAAPSNAVEVTFVGDSVPASITYTPQAQAILGRGLDLRLDLRVCRRLVTESCSYQGTAPPTALQSVQAVGSRLGDVLIVDVGYNESAVGYRAGIDRIMRAARAQGAVGVVWVTLRGDARHLPPDERRDPRRGEALAAAAGRRLERLQPRQAVVLVRRAPHGAFRRRGAGPVPASVRVPCREGVEAA